MPAASAADLLRAHALRPLEADEAAMVADARGFVRAHPDCLERTCRPGHLTGSAWIVSPDRRRTLLTHHRKLDRWLQLGGHADGEADLLAVAAREAREESGLERVRAASPDLFDFDRHWIPARGAESGHWHYDFRFLFTADPAAALAISSESKDLAWVELERVPALNPEPSIARLVRKTRLLP